MDNREKFMEWFKTPKENQIGGYSRADLYGRSPLAAEAWQACAEQKDKEIAELKERLDKNRYLINGLATKG